MIAFCMLGWFQGWAVGALQTELHNLINFQVNSDINVKVVEGGMCSPMGSGMYLLEVSVGV